MRALLLFSVVALSVVLLRLWSSEPVQEADASVVEASARFLAPPQGAATLVQQEVAAPSGKVAAANPAAIKPDPLVEGQARDEAELAVAAALVHGTPADVQAAATRLPRPRALMAEAFAWAMAGEHELAVSLSSSIPRGESPAGEEALLESALSGKAAAPASSGSGSSLQLAMEMLLLARDARELMASGQHASAAKGFSSLLVSELEAPWIADDGVLEEWSRELNEAQSHHRWNPRGSWPAVELEVKSGDSLISIRKRYLAEHPNSLMCTGLIKRANDVKGFLQPGQVLRIPTDEVRVLVDLSARWALYFLGDEASGAWRVGVGRAGEETPPGDYAVKDKIENPPWMKVGQEAIPFGDPRNPLGTRWIGWEQAGRKTSYGFHGTTSPESIGKAESDGCVRFRNEDIEVLFDILPEGAPIRIQG